MTKQQRHAHELKRRTWGRDADYCRERGWVAGDRLSGREGDMTTTIELRYIGESVLVAKRIRQNGKLTPDAIENTWSLGYRKWRRCRRAVADKESS